MRATRVLFLGLSFCVPLVAIGCGGDSAAPPGTVEAKGVGQGIPKPTDGAPKAMFDPKQALKQGQAAQKTSAPAPEKGQ